MCVLISQDTNEIRRVDKLSLLEIVGHGVEEVLFDDFLRRLIQLTDRVILDKDLERLAVSEGSQLDMTFLFRCDSLIIEIHEAGRDFFERLIPERICRVRIDAHDFRIGISGFPDTGEEKCPVAASAFR